MLKNYKLKNFLFILWITSLSSLITYSFIYWHFSSTIGIGFTIVISVSWFFRLQNKVPDHINYYLEAILNDDFSIHSNQNLNNPTLKKIYRNLNRVHTKVKNSIQENEQKEQYFKALIEHISIGVLTYDENGFIIHANTTARELLHLSQLSHIKQLSKVNSDFFQTVVEMKSQQQQLFQLDGAKQKQNILLKSVPFIQHEKQLMLLTLQNIDQQLDEKELDSYLKLIRVLTHEIMNGIAPITSLADSLSYLFTQNGSPVSKDDIDESVIQTTVRGLSVINEQGVGLIKFVDLYRKLTRLPKPNKSIIPLHAFLEKNILLSQAGSYGTDVNFKLQLDNKDIKVSADEKLLSQVVINIFKNGFEALEKTLNPEIIIEVQETIQNQTEISIQNNGPQIPQVVLNEIFVPFYSTKENGSGIGLSLSKQIMRLHGGSLKVHSSSQNTTFTLILN